MLTKVFFSPNGGCTSAIIYRLNRAKKVILIQAYSFTSLPLAQAILAAAKRGVDVTVILDYSEMFGNKVVADLFHAAGIKVYVDAAHKIAHNKIMVIDRRYIITGSFNFTINAEKSNAENLLIIPSSSMATLYINNFQVHLAHSTTYDPSMKIEAPEVSHV